MSDDYLLASSYCDNLQTLRQDWRKHIDNILLDLISFCQNCVNTITKYIVLDSVEVRDDEDNNIDPNNEDFEKVMNMQIQHYVWFVGQKQKDHSVILHEIIKRP